MPERDVDLQKIAQRVRDALHEEFKSELAEPIEIGDDASIAQANHLLGVADGTVDEAVFVVLHGGRRVGLLVEKVAQYAVSMTDGTTGAHLGFVFVEAFSPVEAVNLAGRVEGAPVDREVVVGVVPVPPEAHRAPGDLGRWIEHQEALERFGVKEVSIGRLGYHQPRTRDRLN